MKYTALIITLFLSSPVFSAPDEYNPEALIEYRQDVMTAIKGHNNAVKAIVNGKVPQTKHLDMHISALEEMFRQIDTLFPEGSDFGETNAKDEIWDNPEKFSETIEKAKQAFAKFKHVLKQGDQQAIRTAFKEYGKNSCGSCHKSFKKKDD
jgi:cytochrome c556